MTSIDKVADAYEDNISSVGAWCDEQYDMYFAQHLSGFRIMFDRLKHGGNKVTDEELEDILMALPMKLFDAAEALSVFRLSIETVRIGAKKKECDLARTAKDDDGLSASAAKEYAAENVLDDRLLIAAYESIIERVERELAYCRELIMSAKKIWDARRRVDTANPVSEVTDELPEFVPKDRKRKPKEYITGV